MTKKITFLGIETSCDETAAAVIREKDNGTADILSNIVSSQIAEHRKFGGVVPELAARAHLENIEYIIDAALEESKVSLSELDGIAATAGPGLIVCLTIGLNIGKSIAAFSNKPFVAVNHLEGHALSPGLENNIQFPYLLLLISGGHTQFLIVKNVNQVNLLIILIRLNVIIVQMDIILNMKRVALVKHVKKVNIRLHQVHHLL